MLNNFFKQLVLVKKSEIPYARKMKCGAITLTFYSIDAHSQPHGSGGFYSSA